MRATAFAIAALILCAASASAQADTSAVAVPAAHISATMTAKDAGSAQWFFAMAPDDVLPLLPVNTRLDMLDYYNSGVERPSRDAAGSRAIVTSSTNRRLTFDTGDGSTYELAVYTAGRDTIVALVETLHYPMADSRVEWYDSRWRPLQPLLGEPGLRACPHRPRCRHAHPHTHHRRLFPARRHPRRPPLARAPPRLRPPRLPLRAPLTLWPTAQFGG